MISDVEYQVVLDAETFFSDDYSLRKMATSTYIRDPRFKVHGWAMKVNGGAPKWLGHDEFAQLATLFPWDKSAIIGHNLIFDGSILNWKYGIKPRLWVDTLGMARYVVGNRSAKFGLDHIAQYYGRPGKIKGAALNEVKGVRDPSPAQLKRLGLYALDDADDTWHIFQEMKPWFPEMEYWVMDWTIRMFVNPLLMLDHDILEELHLDEVARKKELLKSLPYTKTQLSSNEQFAEILRDWGIEPPTKTSKTTGKETYAFAKNDLAFQDMKDEHPEVDDIIEGRLAVKSTITETRAARFRDLAKEGPWSVPLNYAGAKQTKRLSGGQSQNPQNLSARGPGARIRSAIYAPKGCVIYVIDSSNIELRTNAAMSGQYDVIERLVSGMDEYATFAQRIYSKPINKGDNPTERNVGKVAVLSLGYQSGGVTYRGMLKAQTGLLLPIEECEGVVRTYRGTYKRIARSWREMKRRLDVLSNGEVPPNLDDEPPIEFFVREEGAGVITGGFRSLYSGATVEWPNLRWEKIEKDGEMRNALLHTANGSGWKSIYGGRAIENMSQFLAREIVNWQMKLIWEQTGFRPQLQVHDELVYVVPKGIAEDFAVIAKACMTGPVTWWPKVICAAEDHIVHRYGEAK